MAVIHLEGTAREPKLAQESKDDPHRHLIILYIAAVVVSAITAFLIT